MSQLTSATDDNVISRDAYVMTGVIRDARMNVIEVMTRVTLRHDDSVIGVSVTLCLRINIAIFVSATQNSLLNLTQGRIFNGAWAHFEMFEPSL